MNPRLAAVFAARARDPRQPAVSSALEEVLAAGDASRAIPRQPGDVPIDPADFQQEPVEPVARGLTAGFANAGVAPSMPVESPPPPPLGALTGGAIGRAAEVPLPAKTVTVAYPDPERIAAEETDEENRKRRIIEGMGHTLVSAFSRQPVAGSALERTDALKQYLQRKQMERQGELDAAKQAHEGRMEEMGEKRLSEQERLNNFLMEKYKSEEPQRAANVQKTQAETKVLEGKGKGGTGPNMKSAGDLRKEFNGLQQVKDYQQVKVAFEKIRAAAVNPSAAGDISLLTGYMKLLDPGSTVREGEFATAANAGGVPDKIQARYNNLLRGERLTPEQRADFVAQARGVFAAQQKSYEEQAARYADLARRSGARPEDVIGADVGASASPAASSAIAYVKQHSNGEIRPLPEAVARQMEATGLYTIVDKPVTP